MWKKVKLLKMSNFKFSHNVFCAILYLKILKPFPKQALAFTCLQDKSFENTVGKGETAHNEQFLLFPTVFLPILRVFCHFHHTVKPRYNDILCPHTIPVGN